MDGSQFDHLTRALGAVRTRRTAALLVGASLAAPFARAVDVAGKRKKHKRKKKKKTCASTCAHGCCTSTYGTCLPPAQQSTGQCGAGGEICHGGCPACTAERACPAGQCCKGDGTCGACLVFVTSTPLTGSLGGLTGADAICQSLAANAGLPGIYMAWLSDDTGSPSARFTRSTATYTLVDGTVIAANWSVLTSGVLAHAIDVSELGTSVSTPDLAWSDTTISGAFAGGDHCLKWATSSASQGGRAGRISRTDAEWTAFTFPLCSSSQRLYCFQQR